MFGHDGNSEIFFVRLVSFLPLEVLFLSEFSLFIPFHLSRPRQSQKIHEHSSSARVRVSPLTPPVMRPHHDIPSKLFRSKKANNLSKHRKYLFKDNHLLYKGRFAHGRNRGSYCRFAGGSAVLSAKRHEPFNSSPVWLMVSNTPACTSRKLLEPVSPARDSSLAS